jgi:hypothetical protein
MLNAIVTMCYPCDTKKGKKLGIKNTFLTIFSSFYPWINCSQRGRTFIRVISCPNLIRILAICTQKLFTYKAASLL